MILLFIRYDAGDRISAREAMRHPYFKDAREAEAQKMQTESPRGVAVIPNATTKSDPSASQKLVKTGLSSIDNSKKLKSVDGSSKVNTTLNKALPNINSGMDESESKNSLQVDFPHYFLVYFCVKLFFFLHLCF
jgi:serine/threonine protein kinase